MPEAKDGSIDLTENSRAPDLGYFLNSRPMQDGFFEFYRTSLANYQRRLDSLGIGNFSADDIFFSGDPTMNKATNVRD